MLAFASKSLGFSDCMADFRIKRMLEGLRREEGPRRDSHQPLTPGILKGVYGKWSTVCTSPFEQRLFHAAALLAFWGALHVGELVAGSKRDTTGRALKVGDISLGNGRVTVTICFSKTDQAGKGRFLVLELCGDVELCPVLALQRYLEVRGQSAGFLFQHSDGSLLTKYHFWAITERALEALGLKGMRFATHSFRIGAASMAAAMGYSVPSIQGIGRWS